MKHVLIDCVDVADVRQTFYNLTDLFTNVAGDTIKKTLKKWMYMLKYKWIIQFRNNMFYTFNFSLLYTYYTTVFINKYVLFLILVEVEVNLSNMPTPRYSWNSARV